MSGYHLEGKTAFRAAGVLLAAALVPVFASGVVREALVIDVPCMMRWLPDHPERLYWYHHLLSFVPVLLISFYQSFQSRDFGYFRQWSLPILAASLVFVSWDMAFTRMGIWGFNQEFTGAMRIGGLPVEEWVWFPVIGFCSLYIHYLLRPLALNLRIWGTFRWGWLLFNLLAIGLFYGRLYTAFAAWSVLLVSWLGQRDGRGEESVRFMRSFAVILIPMVLFDGLLTGLFTGKAVVIYNPAEFSGIRLVSIPMEDFMFGYSFLQLATLLKHRINNWFAIR